MVQKSQTTTWDGAKTRRKIMGFQLPFPQLVQTAGFWLPSTSYGRVFCFRGELGLGGYHFHRVGTHQYLSGACHPVEFDG